MAEMVGVLTHAGFTVAEQRFFVDNDTRDCVLSPGQRLIDLAKVPFYALPHLRGSLLVVGRKPDR